MVPDAPHPDPLGQASLPPMPVNSGVTPPVAPPSVPSAPATTSAVSPLDAAEQAQQLVARYGQDPYQLAESFGQLKAGYLLHNYHITTNPAGN